MVGWCQSILSEISLANLLVAQRPKTARPMKIAKPFFFNARSLSSYVYINRFALLPSFTWKLTQCIIVISHKLRCLEPKMCPQAVVQFYLHHQMEFIPNQLNLQNVTCSTNWTQWKRREFDENLCIFFRLQICYKFYLICHIFVSLTSLLSLSHR